MLKVLVTGDVGLIGSNVVKRFSSLGHDDEQNKSKGYNLVKVKKKLDVGSLSILIGVRGKRAKKSTEIGMVKTGTYNYTPLLSSSFGWSLIDEGMVSEHSLK